MFEKHNPLNILVKGFIKWPCLIIVSCLILSICMSIFALPYFDLSSPDAGLRLRSGDEASNADAYIEAFASHFLRGASSRQILTQTQPTFSLTLLYESNTDESVFSERNLRAIQATEWAILSSSDFGAHCLIDEASRQCSDPKSVVHWFFDGADPKNSNLLAPIDQTLQQMRHAENATSTDFFFDETMQKRTRTRFSFGTPLKNYTSPSDRVSSQADEHAAWIEQFRSFICVDCPSPNDSSIDVLFSGDAIYIAEALSIMTADLTLALIAVAFVGLFMLVHTRSPLVAIGGLLQILLSFPCALYLYAVWFQIELFGALHVLSIFLCLSIGADDIFLIADAFAQFGTFENLEERLLLSFGRALRTMTLTTVTTSIALLLVSLSAVPAIRFFGVFTAILLVVNYMFAVIVTPCLLVINEQRLSGFLCCKKIRFQTKWFEKFAQWLVKRSRIVIGVMLVIAIAFAIVASFLQGASSVFTYWPNGHDFRRVELAKFVNSEDSSKNSIKVLSGIVGIDRTGLSASETKEFGTVIYDNSFEFNAKFQLDAANFCGSIRESREIASELKIVINHNNAPEISCIVTDFRDWRLARNQSFPIDDQPSAIAELRNFLSRYEFGSKHGGNVAFDVNIKPLFLVVASANITASSSAQFEERLSIRDVWKSKVDQSNFDVHTMATDSWFFVWGETQQSFRSNAFLSLLTSLIVVTFVILITTRRLDITLAVLIVLLCIISVVLGFMVSAGFTLGTIESVLIALLVGVSGDYNLHIAFAFFEEKSNLVSALNVIGPSVLAAAISTLLGAFFLLLTTITFFQKFGIFFFVTIFASILFSLTLLPTLLHEFIKLRNKTRFSVDNVNVATSSTTTFDALHDSDALVMSAGEITDECSVESDNDDKADQSPSIADLSRSSARAMCALAIVVFVLLLLAVLLPGLLVQQSADSAVATEPTDSEYVSRWKEVDLSPLRCARGSPFSFFYREKNNTDTLVVEFQGGGACWSAKTCRASSSTFLDTVQVVREGFARNGLGNNGLMNEEKSPTKNAFHLYIPYCTGDLHWGNSITSYSLDVTLEHKGAVNARAVLDFMMKNVFQQYQFNTVLVTGCSAGAYGSFLWTNILAEQYFPHANVVQLADAGVGIISDTFLAESFVNWNATESFPLFMQDLVRTDLSLTLADLYKLSSEHFRVNATAKRVVLFGQVSNAFDWNQAFFYATSKNDSTTARIRRVEPDLKREWSQKMLQQLEDSGNTLNVVLHGDDHCNVPYDRMFDHGILVQHIEYLVSVSSADLQFNNTRFIQRECSNERQCSVGSDMRDDLIVMKK